MVGYPRSVIFRLLGGIAGMALWLGLIVLALTNFDTPAGLPAELQATWPFWLVALLVAAGVFVALRRLGPGPGWGAFALGVIAPFLGLLLNAQTGNSMLFWLVVAVIVLVPLPNRRAEAG